MTLKENTIVHFVHGDGTRDEVKLGLNESIDIETNLEGRSMVSIYLRRVGSALNDIPKWLCDQHEILIFSDALYVVEPDNVTFCATKDMLLVIAIGQVFVEAR